MRKLLEIRVQVKRVPLTRHSTQALRRLDSFDMVVFSSKHARKFFMQLLRERRTRLPAGVRIVHVGPRAELLKLPLAGKRVLYPRSALAPFDIIRRLRARGARVVPLKIYTALPAPLSASAQRSIARAEVDLYFRSPSGVHGLLSQLSPSERRVALRLPAQCIGATTAAAARAAGFRKVSIKHI